MLRWSSYITGGAVGSIADVAVGSFCFIIISQIDALRDSLINIEDKWDGVAIEEGFGGCASCDFAESRCRC